MQQVVLAVQPEHQEVLVVVAPAEAAVYTMVVIQEMVVLVELVELEVKQELVELEELEVHLVILEAQVTMELQVLQVLQVLKVILEVLVELALDKAMLVLLEEPGHPVLEDHLVLEDQPEDKQDIIFITVDQ